ncbi:unnamed protein product [Sphagnum balticum]
MPSRNNSAVQFDRSPRVLECWPGRVCAVDRHGRLCRLRAQSVGRRVRGERDYKVAPGYHTAIGLQWVCWLQWNRNMFEPDGLSTSGLAVWHLRLVCGERGPARSSRQVPIQCSSNTTAQQPACRAAIVKNLAILEVYFMDSSYALYSETPGYPVSAHMAALYSVRIASPIRADHERPVRHGGQLGI